METKVKKRGRKSKDEYYLNKQIDKVSIKDRAIIIKLPIKLEDCLKKINIKREQEILSANPELISPYDKENNFECPEYKNNIISIEIKPKSSPVYSTVERCDKVTYYDIGLLPNKLTKQDIPLEIKTGISCYWCCHSFDTRPVFMPTRFDGKIFHVKGIFCSFECCFSYMLGNTKYSLNTHLLKYMFNLTTKTKFFRESIKKAPPRESLKMFGGHMTISEFRNGNSDYRIYHCPMTYIPDIIEKKEKILDVKNTEFIKPNLTETVSNIKLPKNSLNKFIKIKQ